MSVRQPQRLRKNPTQAEKRLWPHLRNRQVANLKFRRQHPLDDRIVDFFCAEAKLAIELDGSGHTSYRGQTSDLDREIELYEKGIRVRRFHNTDVFHKLPWRFECNYLRGKSQAVLVAADHLSRLASSSHESSPSFNPFSTTHSSALTAACACVSPSGRDDLLLQTIQGQSALDYDHSGFVTPSSFVIRHLAYGHDR